MEYFNELSSIVTDIVRAFIKGDGRTRGFILFGSILVFAGIITGVTLHINGYGDGVVAPFTAIPIVIGGLFVIIGVAIYNSIKNDRKYKYIQDAEIALRNDPGNAVAAWELAQAKLELYIDRNLGQINSIYKATLGVMLVGFMLIVAGVVLCYVRPNEITPGLVAASSGIVTNFIGLTFMVIFKSTTKQAVEYVSMLERMNAVGMAINVNMRLGDDDGRNKGFEKIREYILKDR